MEFDVRKDYQECFNIVAPWGTRQAMEKGLPSYVKGYHEYKTQSFSIGGPYIGAFHLKPEFADWINGYYVVVLSLDREELNAKVKLKLFDHIPALEFNTYWWIGIFEVRNLKIWTQYSKYESLCCRSLDVVLSHVIRPFIAAHPLPDTAPKQLTINF